MIFSADGSQWAPDQPQIVEGLRGLASCEIVVRGARSDQHSGLHGGGIANPAMALAQILASMKAPDGTVTVEGFYDDVRPLTEAERAAIAEVPFESASYLAETGAPSEFGELWLHHARAALGAPDAGGQRADKRLAGRGNQDRPARRGARQDHLPPRRPTSLPSVSSRSCARMWSGIAPWASRSSSSPGQARGNPFLTPRGHNSSVIAAQVLEEVYGAGPTGPGRAVRSP